jgi:hypothetical protein
MKRILIAGDSWGCGVFDPWHESGYFYTGQGIHTILQELGYQVKNISQGGCANSTIIDRLSGIWNDSYTAHTTDFRDQFDYNEIDYIVFLQTDVFREKYYYGKQNADDTGFKWKLLEKNFVNNLLSYDSIDEFTSEYFAGLYTKLNKIGQDNNKKILCIGGWSQLHPIISDYEFLIPVLPSATKFLLPDLKEDLYLSDPEWFDQLSKDKKIMDKFGIEIKNMTIANAEKLELLYKYWKDVHPDIAGYRQIVDKILPYFG